MGSSSWAGSEKRTAAISDTPMNLRRVRQVLRRTTTAYVCLLLQDSDESFEFTAVIWCLLGNTQGSATRSRSPGGLFGRRSR